MYLHKPSKCMQCYIIFSLHEKEKHFSSGTVTSYLLELPFYAKKIQFCIENYRLKCVLKKTIYHYYFLQSSGVWVEISYDSSVRKIPT